MRTWNDWSDFEINVKVAELKGLEISCEQHFDFSDRDERCVFVIDHCKRVSVVNYCGSWSDTGTIIVENNISLEYYDYPNKDWLASTAFSLEVFSNKNPLRGASIVFLMMNGVEENEECLC